MTLDELLRRGDSITVLLEAESSAGMRYLSNTGYVSAPDDAEAPNRAYPDWLVGVPEIRESLPRNLFGRSETGFSDAIIDNPHGVRDSWLDEAWDGREARLRIGARHWPLADFVTVFHGTATGMQADADGKLRLVIGDPKELVNRPVQEGLLDSGPAQGAPVPLAYGEVFNVEPANIDAALHRYRVHEGAVPAIPDVRVGGLTVSYTADTSEGRFDTNVMPDGRVTADVEGPLSRADELLVALAERVGVTSVDTAAMAALASAAPYALGLWIGDRENAIDVMDSIAESVGAWWGFDAQGRLTAAIADIGTPVGTLTADDLFDDGIELQEVQLPAWRVRVGYRRNWTVQTDGLFAAVEDDDRQRFGREYDIATADDDSVRSLHPLARDPDVQGTLLVDEVDADAEAARRLALFGTLRRRYRAVATRRASPFRPGQTVTLVHPRFGLSAGVDLLLTSTSRQLDSRNTELELWG